MKEVELSIIILTYNTKDIVYDAVRSIEENYPDEVKNGTYEVIVCDNASTDGTLDFFKNYKAKSKFKSFSIIDNGENLGFSKGNNKGVPYAHGRYILFLNPDTVVYKDTLSYLTEFMNRTAEAGAVSCKLVNKDGEIDNNCHRGFPTPWNAFCYFSGLTRVFPKSRIFAGYTQGWKDMNTTHEVDAIEGAFMLMPREIGEKVGWWDEDYFFYGEDLQFCYDIKKLGYKIYYVGGKETMHIGGVSSGIKKKTKNITSANIETKRRLQKARFEAMRIFYKKNYRNVYPRFITFVIESGIKYLENKALAGIRVTN